MRKKSHSSVGAKPSCVESHWPRESPYERAGVVLLLGVLVAAGLYATGVFDSSSGARPGAGSGTEERLADVDPREPGPASGSDEVARRAGPAVVAGDESTAGSDPAESEAVRIFGSFVDRASREPIRGVRVELAGWLADDSEDSDVEAWTAPPVVESDALGRFEFEASIVPGYEHVLIAQAEGWSRIASRWEGLRPGTSNDLGVMFLDRADWVGTVEVRNELGDPLPDFEFSISIDASYVASIQPLNVFKVEDRSITTDALGRAEIDAPFRLVGFPRGTDRQLYWLDSDGRDGVLVVTVLQELVRARITALEEIDPEIRVLQAIVRIAGTDVRGQMHGYDIDVTLGEEFEVWRQPGAVRDGLTLYPRLMLFRPREGDRPDFGVALGIDVPVEWRPVGTGDVVELEVSIDGWEQQRTGPPVEFSRFEVRIAGLTTSEQIRRLAGADGSTKLRIYHPSGDGSLDVDSEGSPDRFEVEVEALDEARLFTLIIGPSELTLGRRVVADGVPIQFPVPEFDVWEGELHWPSLSVPVSRSTGRVRGAANLIRLGDDVAPVITREIQFSAGSVASSGPLLAGRYVVHARDFSEAFEIRSDSPPVVSLRSATNLLSLDLLWADGSPMQGEVVRVDVAGESLWTQDGRLQSGLLVFPGLPSIDVEIGLGEPRLRWFRRPVPWSEWRGSNAVRVEVPKWPE